MATEDDFNGDPLSSVADDPLSGSSFTELLESDDVGPFLAGGPFRPSSLSDGSRAKVLCFGYDSQNEGEMGFFETGVMGQKTGISGGNSSSTSSSSSLSKSMKAGSGGGKMEKKREVVSGSDSVLDLITGSGSIATAESSRKAPKKPIPRPTSSARPLKVKKEKLGERITALQKLVSPFGKTDTASVLHEAMGYIRFLHDQVQVLSSPYLEGLPSSTKLQEGGEAESRYDLRSRGLCLVPVECTVHVARSNGADFWSPAMGSNPCNG